MNYGEEATWADDAWTLEQVRDHLRDFGVELTLSTLRTLVADLGIRPAFKMTSRKKRGISGYHDPLVAWVLAVAKSRSDGSTIADLKIRLDECRDVAEEAVWGTLAYRPRQRDKDTVFEWGWRVQSVAYHLFITDMRHGPGLRLLHQWLSSKPQLLMYTLDSNMCLEAVLRGYASRVIAATAHVHVKPEDINFFDGDERPLYNDTFPGTETTAILESYRIEVGHDFGPPRQIMRAEKNKWPGPWHSVQEPDPGAPAPGNPYESDQYL